MRSCAPVVAASLTSLLFASSVFAQTYSKCNPIEETCAADPALGTTSNTNFASQSSDYTETGNSCTYSSDGAQLSVGESGDNPTLTSTWYIMFGKVDFTFKAAPGVGMVSSAILLSDDLDEIDWEILGADATSAQTNYFSKGITGTIDPGGAYTVPDSQSEFVTYTIDWSADQISWIVNGATVRTLTSAEAGGAYPQTPMQVKVGAWAGGDPSNAEGTIEWAGGAIDYAEGPFVMQVQSVNVQDYSTGSKYEYDGTAGTWESITAVGGSVNSGSGYSSAGPPSDSSPDSTPDSTPTSIYSPSPTFGGTYAETSAYVTPSTWPWVPSPTAEGDASATAGPPASSYLAELGYKTSSAAIAPPTQAWSTPSSPPASWPAAAPGPCETITGYNQQGRPAVVVVPVNWVKSYNEQGALVTPACGGGAAAVQSAPLAVVTQIVGPASSYQLQTQVRVVTATALSPGDGTFNQGPAATGTSNGAGRLKLGFGAAVSVCVAVVALAM